MQTLTEQKQAEQTLTEQKLCSLWARAEASGEWWDMYTELADIADVLEATGHAEGAALFAEAAEMALNRRMYQMRIAA